jgi:hypothetical protein
MLDVVLTSHNILHQQPSSNVPHTRHAESKKEVKRRILNTVVQHGASFLLGCEENDRAITLQLDLEYFRHRFGKDKQ